MSAHDLEVSLRNSPCRQARELRSLSSERDVAVEAFAVCIHVNLDLITCKHASALGTRTTQFAMPTGSRTHSKNRCAYRSLSRHSPYASNPKAFRLRASSQRQSSVLDAHGSLLHAKCDDAMLLCRRRKKEKENKKKVRHGGLEPPTT